MAPSGHLAAPDDHAGSIMVQVLIGGVAAVGRRAHTVSPCSMPSPNINQLWQMDL